MVRLWVRADFLCCPPQKTTIVLKGVKSDSKIIISLHWSKCMTHSVKVLRSEATCFQYKFYICRWRSSRYILKNRTQLHGCHLDFLETECKKRIYRMFWQFWAVFIFHFTFFEIVKFGILFVWIWQPCSTRPRWWINYYQTRTTFVSDILDWKTLQQLLCQ